MKEEGRAVPSYVRRDFITGGNTSGDFSSGAEVQTRGVGPKREEVKARTGHDHAGEVTKYKRRGSCAPTLTFIS